MILHVNMSPFTREQKLGQIGSGVSISLFMNDFRTIRASLLFMGALERYSRTLHVSEKKYFSIILEDSEYETVG